MSPAIYFFIAIIVGFVTGVVLSRVVINDARGVYNHAQAAFQAVSTDLHALHARIDGIVGKKE